MKKHREFFYLAKAAALAEAIVNVAQGVTKALAQGGFWGKVMAATVAASGAVQIAKISAQSLAAGGSILGWSPSATADNIPVWATAGEYIHPVAAVKYYGTEIMEAIRRRLIPREFFANLQLPSLSIPRPSFAFETGGQVSAQAPSAQGMETTIINIVDPREIDRYLASAAGQNAIVNVIGTQADKIRRMLR